MLQHNLKLRVCYICDREFGSHSIGIHEPKCLEKWHLENNKLPLSKRRSPPIKSQLLADVDQNQINEAAYQSAKARLIPCKNCSRTFNPDHLSIHECSCKSSKLPPILSFQRTATRIISSPKVIQVSNRVDIAISSLPRQNTIIKKSVSSNFTSRKTQNKSKTMNGNPRGRGRSVSRKPQLVVCYICGREFTGASLPIHEPQCLEKWKMENARLPREHRRPLPKKPQAIGGGGKASMEAMNLAAAEAARGNLVPCRGCGRKFATDRIEVHERICLKGGVGGDGGSNKMNPVGSNGLPTHSGDNRNPMTENGMSKSGGGVRKSRQPKFVFCYICGRQFTDASLPIHEPQCMEKWDMQNNLLPREQRRPRPRKPEALKNGTGGMTREQLQEVQWEAAQANRVPCKRCGRKFNPDRVAIHERSCKVSGVMVEDDHSPPRGSMTGGGEFGRDGDESPRMNRSSRVGRVPGQKPVSVICYLCGRDFGTKSIEIHQPQCLQKWHIENDKLPRHLRRPEPKKPQNVPISGTGTYDIAAANEAAYQTAMDSRVACENCGRKFNTDRIAVHQRSCRPK